MYSGKIYETRQGILTGLTRKGFIYDDFNLVTSSQNMISIFSFKMINFVLILKMNNRINTYTTTVATASGTFYVIIYYSSVYYYRIYQDEEGFAKSDNNQYENQ